MGDTLVDDLQTVTDMMKRSYQGSVERNFARLLGISANDQYIRYNGQGRFRLRLLTGDMKIPDFVCSRDNAVIEIFETHHLPKEEAELTRRYGEIGVRCLVIWEQEIDLCPGMTKRRVCFFLRNGAGRNFPGCRRVNTPQNANTPFKGSRKPVDAMARKTAKRGGDPHQKVV